VTFWESVGFALGVLILWMPAMIAGVVLINSTRRPR